MHTYICTYSLLHIHYSHTHIHVHDRRSYGSKYEAEYFGLQIYVSISYAYIHTYTYIHTYIQAHTHTQSCTYCSSRYNEADCFNLYKDTYTHTHTHINTHILQSKTTKASTSNCAGEPICFLKTTKPQFQISNVL